ncbi:sugar phosphate nucleotidyltransferase [Kiritimatiellaeota bacterium B1221]|nr:sugar phosphate nucleotidyltransferase [Kiritimatiellaeota bacterium B1221]
MRPEKAIVLAAGFGSRLSPVTDFCPKPLVPLHGKAMILHQLELLQSWGVKEVLVNVHHLADVLVAELPKICPEGLKLNLSFEAEILGTGGGLRRMAWFMDDDPLWVCNADVYQKLNPEPLLNAWVKEQPLACLWMIPDQGPQTVRVEKGRVVDFRAGGQTFSGLHLMNRRTLDYLPERNFSSIIEAYDAGLAAGEKILGVEVPKSVWADVGTPDQLLAAEGGAVIFPGAQLRKTQKARGLVVAPAWGLSKAEQKALPEATAVELLPARGSDRRFRRLFFFDHSEIFIRSGEARPENNRFVGHSRFLAQRGIRVPQILKSRQQGRWLQVEDLGTEHLLDRLQAGSPARNVKDMRGVLESVAAFHALKIPAQCSLETPFDPALYAWERELFEKEYVGRFGEVSELRNHQKSLFRIPEILMAQPQVLVHRDLQSTNIMRVVETPDSRVHAEVIPAPFRARGVRPGEMKPERERPLELPRKRGTPAFSWALIDYQGMRRGAAAYDLGSLLADPYVNRPLDLQMDLLKYYNQVAAEEVAVEVLAAGAVQRLMQALGAYGRLGALKGNERFLDHIPAALNQLAHWVGAFLEGQGKRNPLREDSR